MHPVKISEKRSNDAVLSIALMLLSRQIEFRIPYCLGIPELVEKIVLGLLVVEKNRGFRFVITWLGGRLRDGIYRRF